MSRAIDRHVCQTLNRFRRDPLRTGVTASCETDDARVIRGVRQGDVRICRTGCSIKLAFVRPRVAGAYAFWSGFGSDLGEVAIVGSIMTVVRRHNCGVHGCWHFGRHEYEMNGIKHKLCPEYHPGIDASHQFTADEFQHHHDSKRPKAQVDERRTD